MFRKLHEADSGSVTIEIDGILVQAELGESLAAVLLRQADLWSRVTPVTHSKRAPYCMMGVCFDCVAEVDGRTGVQTCLTFVREGMRVSRQRADRSIGR